MLAPDFIADPFPIYDRLRASSPVAQLANGGVLLTRHADVLTAFSDRRLSNRPSRFSPLRASQADRNAAASLARNIPPFQDLPEHAATRLAMIRAFTRAFASFRAELPDLSRDFLAGKAQGGTIELTSDVGRPFAALAICRFLGLRWDEADIVSFAEAFFALFGPIRDVETFSTLNSRMDDARRFVGAAIADGRISDEGFIGHLLNRGPDEGAPDGDVLIDLALLVAADGVKNVEAGIVGALHLLHRHPHHAMKIAEGAPPEPFVREALRLETPAQVLPRVAKESFTLHGVEIKADFPVYLALGSANRDPAVFADAGSFLPHRKEDCAVTFGQGKHRCIGEPLAVATIGAMLQGLLQHGVAPAAPDAGLEYHARFGHRWPQAYRVSFS